MEKVDAEVDVLEEASHGVNHEENIDLSVCVSSAAFGA